MNTKEKQSVASKRRAFSTQFEDHKGLLHKFSKGGFARLCEFGISIDYEDVFQENCVSLVRAQKTYSPESGITFSAYMGRSVMNNFNKFAKRLITERTEVGLLSIEDLGDADSDGTQDAMDYLMNRSNEEESPSIEEQIECMETARANIAKLSPKAKLVIRDLLKPSKALTDQHSAEYAHHMHAKSMGEATPRVPKQIDLRYVVRFHGLKHYKFEAEMRESLGVASL